MQQPVYRIVHHAQYVGVACDEYSGSGGLYTLYYAGRIVSRPASDMRHQYVDTFGVEKCEAVVYAVHRARVDVAPYCAQRLECGQAVGKLQRPYVARMPDLVDWLQELLQHTIECSVRIRYDSDFHNCIVRLPRNKYTNKPREKSKLACIFSEAEYLRLSRR